MARERAVRTLNAEEIEGMRKVCRVSMSFSCPLKLGLPTDVLLDLKRGIGYSRITCSTWYNHRRARQDMS